MLQLFVYVYVLIPNEALWWEEAEYACVYGINESARAHCKICPKINGRNITLIYVKRIVRWMCTNCQKLKRNGIDIKRLRKRRKETAKEWVTASVCVLYVYDNTRREIEEKEKWNKFLRVTIHCRISALHWIAVPMRIECKTNKSSWTDRWTQSHKCTEKARKKEQANAAMHPPFQLSKYYIQNQAKKHLHERIYRRLPFNQIRIQIKRKIKCA